MSALALKRSLPLGVAMVCVAVGVYLGLVALGVNAGGGARRARGAGSQSTAAPLATYSAGAPHVLSSVTVYPRGGDFGSPTVPEPPTDPALFAGPIATYRAYAVAQLGVMEGQITKLLGALEANDRAAAQSEWRDAYTSYLHLGAVYLAGEVAALNQQINGRAASLQGGVANPEFMGLHRIEYGLWTGAAPSSLAGYARRLELAVRTLRGVLGHVAITPLEYATRAHEILEDAQRDLLSGADVPWSGEGVLATAAGVTATEKVLSTLRRLFRRDDHALPDVEVELAALRGALASIAAAHGGRLPGNGSLTHSQAELLDGALGGALEALSLVPGSLETERPPVLVQIPKADLRIDP